MAEVRITLPDDLLAAVERAAEQASRSRDDLIADAVRARLVGPDLDRRSLALGALRRSLGAGAWVPEDLVRDLRGRGDGGR